MRRALVLTLAAVVGVGFVSFAQYLSGEWNASLIINPNAGTVVDFLDFSSDVTVDFEVGGWTFTSTTKLDDAGWIDQTFAAAGALGAWTFDMLLDMDPAGPFDALDVESSVSIGGVTFGLELELAGQDIHLAIEGEGSTGLVDLEIAVAFGGDNNNTCDLNWHFLGILASFPFCCIDAEALAWVHCTGLHAAAFHANDIVIPRLPWVTLTAQLYFQLAQTDSKRLILFPDFDFGEFDACFELYVDMDALIDYAPGGTTELRGFIVDGINLECEIGGIAFTATSFWGEHACRFWTPEGPVCDFPGILAGKNQEYWEAYRIATADDACCGPFGFDVTVYFDEQSTSLFDVGLFEADLTLQLSEQLEFTTGFMVDDIAGLTEWTIGFTVLW